MAAAAIVAVLAGAAALAAATNTHQCIAQLARETPVFVAGELRGYAYADFNVISFGDFAGSYDGGDIEGRLAVRGNVTFLEGFSIGAALRTAGAAPVDEPQPYSLVLGGSRLCWPQGSLFPDGSDTPFDSDGAAAGFFAATAQPVSKQCRPRYFDGRQTGQCAAGQPDCLADEFDEMRRYYRQLAADWAAAPANAQPFFLGTGATGRGLGILAPANTPERIVVRVRNSDWNKVFYQRVFGLNTTSQYLVVVIENDDNQPTLFRHGLFENILDDVENSTGSRIVFVLNGPGPQVLAQGGVIASILAPDRAYNQSWGVTHGFVIVGSVIELHQANKPDCQRHWVVAAPGDAPPPLPGAADDGDRNAVAACLAPDFVTTDLVAVVNDARLRTLHRVIVCNGGAGVFSHTGALPRPLRLHGVNRPLLGGLQAPQRLIDLGTPGGNPFGSTCAVPVPDAELVGFRVASGAAVRTCSDNVLVAHNEFLLSAITQLTVTRGAGVRVLHNTFTHPSSYQGFPFAPLELARTAATVAHNDFAVVDPRSLQLADALVGDAAAPGAALSWKAAVRQLQDELARQQRAAAADAVTAQRRDEIVRSLNGGQYVGAAVFALEHTVDGELVIAHNTIAPGVGDGILVCQATADPADPVRIEDNTVAGRRRGVAFVPLSASNVRISRNAIDDCELAIDVANTHGPVVNGNQFVAHGALVSNNRIAGCPLGVVAGQSPLATLEHNRVAGSTVAGIQATDSDGILVRLNSVHCADGDGIDVVDSSDVQVSENTVAGCQSGVVASASGRIAANNVSVVGPLAIFSGAIGDGRERRVWGNRVVAPASGVVAARGNALLDVRANTIAASFALLVSGAQTHALRIENNHIAGAVIGIGVDDAGGSPPANPPAPLVQGNHIAGARATAVDDVRTGVLLSSVRRVSLQKNHVTGYLASVMSTGGRDLLVGPNNVLDNYRLHGVWFVNVTTSTVRRNEFNEADDRIGACDIRDVGGVNNVLNAQNQRRRGGQPPSTCA